eukprot:7383706-Prymnesium_polylepis.2
MATGMILGLVRTVSSSCVTRAIHNAAGRNGSRSKSFLVRVTARLRAAASTPRSARCRPSRS